MMDGRETHLRGGGLSWGSCRWPSFPRSRARHGRQLRAWVAFLPPAGLPELAGAAVHERTVDVRQQRRGPPSLTSSLWCTTGTSSMVNRHCCSERNLRPEAQAKRAAVDCPVQQRHGIAACLASCPLCVTTETRPLDRLGQLSTVCCSSLCCCGLGLCF